jgi:hypothetical protein
MWQTPGNVSKPTSLATLLLVFDGGSGLSRVAVYRVSDSQIWIRINGRALFRPQELNPWVDF